MGWIIGAAIIAVIVIIILWFISTQRRLVVLDENINNAMSQIAVQLTSRFDALTALLDLTKGYASHEAETLEQTIKARRTVISSSSTAQEIRAQENVLTETMGRIMAVAEQYPDLKANTNYIQTMNSVNSYESTVRGSRLIYNDSVTKLNRAVRMFPANLIAGMLGFSQRAYLETDEKKTDMPSMK